jgi:hypothetical protein
VLPDEERIAATAAYHEELVRAGVLHSISKGRRIQYASDRRTVIDGPCAETKELAAGYTLIRVGSRQEALEWRRKILNLVGPGAEAEIEIRALFELEDFGPGEAVDRLRGVGAEGRNPS